MYIYIYIHNGISPLIYDGFQKNGGTLKSSKSWMTILVLKPMVT